MGFVRTVVHRPVATLMLFVVAVGLGLYTVGNISVDLLPNVVRPRIVVSTSYSGAGPTEVEREVTEPLEAALSNIGGLESISSTSAENSSRIGLDFYWDVDLTEATNDVRDKIDSVRNQLPDGADLPRILKFDPSNIPILQIALGGDRPTEDLREIAEDYVQTEIEQIDGVGQADIRGGRDRLVRVDVNLAALASKNVTLADVARSIGGQSIQSFGGELPQGERRLLVRTAGEFTGIEDVEDVVITYAEAATGRRLSASGSRPVLLREIASVGLGVDEVSRTVHVNGKPGVILAVIKESGANTIDVAARVKARLEEIRFGLPEGIELVITSDTTTSISASLQQVSSTLLVGGALTMLVLFGFLRNFRATFIIGLAIPISLLATLAAMYFGGLTLNIISMSGLVLGIGMVVDSSIVVLENIYRKRSGGLSVEEASIRGTEEMITPIMASSLTTMSVFLPVLLFRRALGSFSVIIGDVAFTVVVAIAASTAVAVLLVPVLASTYVPLHVKDPKAVVKSLFRRIDDALDRGFSRMEAAYQRALRLVLHHRSVVVLVVVAAGAVVGSMVPRLGFIFSPTSAEDTVSVNVTLREGTRLETTETEVLRMGEILRREHPEILDIIATAGGGGFGSGASTNAGQLTVRLPAVGKRTMSPQDISRTLRSRADEFPGVLIGSAQNRGQALAGANPIEVVIRSRDIDVALELATTVQRLILQQFPEIVEPELTLSTALPELAVVVDRQRAHDLGISLQALATEIRYGLEGTTAGRYRSGGRTYDIQVMLRPEDRGSIPDLERIFVKNGSGTPVPLAAVARLERESGPVAIQREDKVRTVRVRAGVAAGRDLGAVQRRLEAVIDESILVPDDARLLFRGELAAVQSTGGQLGILLVLAVGLVFAVMAGQFESFLSPFVILFTVPLMFIGVVLLYAVLGLPLSMFSLLGLIMLTGIVVNNGIILVDYTNLLRVRGQEGRTAILEAAGHRLRPILITSTTTILGMVPLAFFPGEGARITQPVGLTIVGGLASSTLLTLFFVPVMYSLIASGRKLRKSDPLANG